MNTDDMKRLQAHEYHGVDAMNATPPETHSNFDISNGKGYIVISDTDTGWNVVLPHSTKQLVYLETRGGADVIIFDSEIDTVIALLQRARDIMNGEE